MTATPAKAELTTAVTALRATSAGAGTDPELDGRVAWLLEQLADSHPTSVVGGSPHVHSTDTTLTCECGVTYQTVMLADLGCPHLAAALAVARRVNEKRGH